MHLFRPDGAHALFVWPGWILLLPGLLPLLFKKQPKAVVLLAWLAALLVTSEEPYSLARHLLPAKKGSLRVVSLNCAGGTLEAAQEVIRLKPDILLLQESPSRPDLEKLKTQLFGSSGSLVWGPDATLLARGSLVPHALPRRTGNFVSAEWKDEEGRTLTITSLRLQPPVLRLDLYDPSAWRSFAENRRERRSELQEILSTLEETPPDIFGGDFNTPPERSYVKGMADSFAEEGRGYGATCVNPYPCIVRIDQIWRSDRLRTVNSFVVKTLHSDHRIAVSDFVWKGE